MEPTPPPEGLPRRRFLKMAGGSALLTASGACGARATPSPVTPPGGARTPIDVSDRFDPWVEIDQSAFQNNVREAARLAGDRPILAVCKNDAYGLGDETVGPMLAALPEVGGLACVRVEEALALRAVGVTKPIVVMAEASEAEMEVLVRNSVLPSVWHDDAPQRIERLAARLGHPVPVQLFLDTGMNREGMPSHRARPWMEELGRSAAAEIDGTYTMLAHDLDFDRIQLERFEELLSWARARQLPLGTLHAAPTVELFHLPEAHYDLVRPGNALFGNYPGGDGVREQADLKPVYRLRARVVRVERVEAGESAGFYRAYEPERPTWVALLPVGRTDGYPSEANGTAEVLIRGRLYPVRGGVNSAHTIVDIGAEPTVEVGDVATLVGPDDPGIHPGEVARRTERSPLRLMQGMNPRLPRRVV